MYPSVTLTSLPSSYCFFVTLFKNPANTFSFTPLCLSFQHCLNTVLSKTAHVFIMLVSSLVKIEEVCLEFGSGLLVYHDSYRCAQQSYSMCFCLRTKAKLFLALAYSVLIDYCRDFFLFTKFNFLPGTNML